MSQFPFFPSDNKSPSTGLGGFGAAGNPPISFDFRHINWLAHIFGNTLIFPDSRQTKEILHAAHQYLFWLNQRGNKPVRVTAFNAITNLRTNWNDYSDFVHKIGAAFSTLPWRVLLIPGGFDKTDYDNPLSSGGVDNLLTSGRFVEDIFKSNPDYRGLIFHLSDIVKKITYLENIYPALRVAFASASEWPGMVVWNVQNDETTFLAFSVLKNEIVGSEVQSVFEVLSSHPNIAVSEIANFLSRSLSRILTNPYTSQRLSIIHTSDMHLGSKIADSRMVTVKNRIQELVATLKTQSRVLPVVTGDLMDTPRTRHLNNLNDYLHFLNNLRTEPPLIVPGNHDVRRLGVFGEKFDELTRLYMRPVAFIDDCKVGVVCFNSVRSGHLAKGHIDEGEFASIGDALDRDKQRSTDYFLVALLHHHPCPVDLPDWYSRTWYERWLGKWSERTDALDNAGVFLEWIKKRGISAVLHGHKHIPRVKEEEGITVIGCGSTVGKVRSDIEGRTFMSINLITINLRTGRLSCRLMAERIVGAGISTYDTHEILFRDEISKPGSSSRSFTDLARKYGVGQKPTTETRSPTQ